MTRWLRVLFVLFAPISTLTVASVAVPQAAHAASKAEIKQQKGRVKEAKKSLKTLQKLSKKWNKASAKGKSTAKVDAELAGLIRSELSALRKQGIPTRRPARGGDDTWGERYRNTLVAVQNAQSEGRKRNQLRELERFFQTRLERQQRRLEKMK